MIWGSISGKYGLGECTFIQSIQINTNVYIGPALLWNDKGRVTGRKYAATMLPLVVDYLYEHPELTFQQDNASTHTCPVSRDTLAAHGIMPMEWPANSPDLNPIETIWQRIKQRLRSRPDPPRRIADLRRMVVEEWNSISLAEIVEIIDTMPERIQAVIEANGGHTKY
jgi:hypothetical protein